MGVESKLPTQKRTAATLTEPQQNRVTNAWEALLRQQCWMYDDATILNGPGMREASPGKTAIQGGPVVLMFVKRLDLEAEMIQERTFDVQYSYGHSYDTKLYNF